MCTELYGEKKVEPPKITIVIVGKRHHTRFYPTDESHADRKHGCNPFPGTVVDRGITMQNGWDFYLQAHAALKGTVSAKKSGQSVNLRLHETGETSPLRRHPRRHQNERGGTRKDHAQPLLPLRTGHQSRLLLPARVLCRPPVRARPLLSHEVREHARQATRHQVRSQCRGCAVEVRCESKVGFFFFFFFFDFM